MPKVTKINNTICLEIENQSFIISEKEALEIASGIMSILVKEQKPVKREVKRKSFENALTQFELHTLKEHYSIELEKKLNDLGIKNTDWFPHITGTGGYVTFVTRSQRILDKVNKALGTKLGFDIMKHENIYYL